MEQKDDDHYALYGCLCQDRNVSALLILLWIIPIVNQLLTVFCA